MSFDESVVSVFSKTFDFQGRASRPEYWWFVVFEVLAFLIAALINSKLPIFLAILIVIPKLAVAARRLHDSNRSGWLQLLDLIPLVGSLMMLYFLVQPSVEPNRYGELD